MRTVTTSNLRRRFRSILASVERGETVEISKRGRVIALLSPAGPGKAKRVHHRPDFLARFKRRYGALRLQGNVVLHDRESRAY